ncbi:MAG: SDR family oxidoreductase [Mycobacteriaceae bacterium]|uniref:SDR family oxidoreductase n=1 Tax=Corynebacterium sp. TaxID=1720 RepID=UPI003F96C665
MAAGNAGRVADRVALVTGAAGGIGDATVRRLVDEGARVAAVDLHGRAPDLEHLRDDLGAGAVLPLVGDVTDQASLDRAAAEAVEHFGRIDILFANAGILVPEGSVEDLDEETWQRIIDIDLTGVWRTAKAVFPHLKRNPQGSSVILASSTAGIRASAGAGAYAAAKTGLTALTSAWAHELGPFGGRVNATHPTAVGTDLVLNRQNLRRYRPDLDDPLPADVVGAFSAGKLLDVPWIEPVDVANAVLFLASDEARYITGTSLVIDAGSTVKWG